MPGSRQIGNRTIFNQSGEFQNLSLFDHNEEQSIQTPKGVKITRKDFENYVKTGNIRNRQKSIMNNY
jgi:hypothetical protein